MSDSDNSNHSSHPLSASAEPSLSLDGANSKSSNKVVPITQANQINVDKLDNSEPKNDPQHVPMSIDEIMARLEMDFYHFDFSEWAELAKNDPEGFEKKRREIIDQTVDRCLDHNKQRIRGLQWRIDQQRRISSSPMDACLKIYGQMWERFAGEEDGLNSHLQALNLGDPSTKFDKNF